VNYFGEAQICRLS